MEKAHVAAGGSFCGVCGRPKFLGVFTQFCPSQLQFLGIFTQFCPSPLKNWISVGDRITGLFPWMVGEEVVRVVLLGWRVVSVGELV